MSEKRNDVIIGIDLGTTNSEVAIVIDGRIDVVADESGPILPSYVGLAPDGKLLVGHEARNQYALYPEATVRSIKRKMGSEETVALGDRSYRPQEISAMILGTLKKRAEAQLGHSVGKAVVTVPAYFSDAQRQATRDAGSIAGLEVVRIINEPTAACLAYENEAEGERTVLAFDLGGGTFDVSIVKVDGEIVEVIASHGDNQLGGDDFDELILDRLIKSLDCADDPLIPSSENRLRHAAEAAKIRLTEDVSVSIIEDHLETQSGAQLHLDFLLERPEFDAWSHDLVMRMLGAVHKALHAADKKRSDIDDIVLVGGATRMPLVTEILERDLGQRPRHDVHPDLAVAYGAGIMAARLMGSGNQRILVDITPYTFGVQVLSELHGEMSIFCFSPVIHAGTPLPATRSIITLTVQDGQIEAEANVFQGESPDCRQNILVGRFTATGFPAGLPASSPVIIRMDLDIDGILRVTAIEKSSGSSCAITIDNALAKLSEADLDDARANMTALFGDDLDDYEDDDEPDDPSEQKEEFALLALAQPVIDRVGKARDQMDDVDGADADSLAAELKVALAARNTSRVKEICLELEDLLFYIDSN